MSVRYSEVYKGALIDHIREKVLELNCKKGGVYREVPHHGQVTCGCVEAEDWWELS